MTREDRKAESCQVKCQLESRKQLIMLVTGRRGREERSRVDSGFDGDVSISNSKGLIERQHRKTRA